MEVYFIPYKPNHRYWTGLLLLVRVGVYLVSAFNPSGDPRVTLTATNVIITSLVIYIATFGVTVYKNHFITATEILVYFNIIALSTFTWYTLDADTNQTAITNISIGITFVQLKVVILYHTFKHTNKSLFTRIQGSRIFFKTKEKLSVMQNKQKRIDHQRQVPTDKDVHQFHELLDMIDHPVNTNDYNIPHVQPKGAEPTYSVVELPMAKPFQAHATPCATLETIKEEKTFVSQQATIDSIPVDENLATAINDKVL